MARKRKATAEMETKTLTEEQKTMAIEIIADLMTNEAEEYNDNTKESFDVFGRLGTMTPISRAAWIKRYGLDVVMELEEEAKKRI